MTIASPPDTSLRALSDHLLGMPPVRAMGLRVLGFDGEILRLQAPLAPNVNDKGCAFGGSLAGLMTLAGWGLATLKLGEAGQRAEVYVADSHVRYLAPLHADLVAEAMLAPGESWDAFLSTFAARGRARITLQARIALPDGGDACTLQARFAALAPAGAVG